MQANYQKLWIKLKETNMKKIDLLTAAGISKNILAKMSKGEYVSMDSLQKICRVFDCDVGDIVTLKDCNDK